MAYGNSGHDPHTADPAGDAAPTDFAAAAPETWQQLESDWWSESVDGRCSESAALFAASQPAPLSVV